MKKQDKQEINDQQPVIEDLTVYEEQAAEVKGGDGKALSISGIKLEHEG